LGSSGKGVLRLHEPSLGGVSNLQIGGWLTPADTNLPRGKPFGNPDRARRYASRARKAERQ